MVFNPEYFKNYGNHIGTFPTAEHDQEIDTIKLLKDAIFGKVDELCEKEVDMDKNKQPSLNFRYFLCDMSGGKFQFFILESDRDKRAEIPRKEIIDPANDCVEELDGLFCVYVTHVGSSENKELEEL